jgi:hypothetical protein
LLEKGNVSRNNILKSRTILVDLRIQELKRKEKLDRPFSLCGRRCYIIGHQNGLFPDIGSHRIGEMGGIWIHPIKIADGFWMSLETEGNWNPIGFFYSDRIFKDKSRNWFTESDEFIMGDGGAWVEHRYNLPKFDLSRREFVPYNDPALGIEVNITPKDKSIKTALLNFLVRFDIKPVWFSGWPEIQFILRLKLRTIWWLFIQFLGITFHILVVAGLQH